MIVPLSSVAVAQVFLQAKNLEKACIPITKTRLRFATMNRRIKNPKFMEDLIKMNLFQIVSAHREADEDTDEIETEYDLTEPGMFAAEFLEYDALFDKKVKLFVACSDQPWGTGNYILPIPYPEYDLPECRFILPPYPECDLP